MTFDALAAQLAAGGVRVEREVPVATLTTYHVGGPVALLVRVGVPAELTALATVVAAERPPLLVVGRGSNLLVADTGFAGVGVVLDGEFEALTFDDDDPALVHAGAAVALPVLARRSAAAGRRGLEFFVGIPGSVGGAVRMNAGGHGRETAEVLVEAHVSDLAADGALASRPPAALGLGYRCSGLSATELVVGATFRSEPGDAAAAEEELAGIVQWRRAHQPGGSNAGSVFANPPGDSAGRLIDSVGLKGLRIGGAEVSPKHANFFQAGPGATADDVQRLVREVRRRVFDATGVRLQPELRMVGFEPLEPLDPVEPAQRPPGVAS